MLIECYTNTKFVFYLDDDYTTETLLGFILKNEYGSVADTDIIVEVVEDGIGNKMIEDSSYGIKGKGLNAIYSREHDISFIVDVSENSVRATGWYWGTPSSDNTMTYNGHMTAEYEFETFFDAR